jgi:hypothetical protein
MDPIKQRGKTNNKQSDFFGKFHNLILLVFGLLLNLTVLVRLLFILVPRANYVAFVLQTQGSHGATGYHLIFHRRLAVAVFYAGNV